MTTRTVKTSGGDYTTLAAAYTASDPGDTIVVYAGDYTAAGSQNLDGNANTSGSPMTIVAADGEAFAGDFAGTYPKFARIYISDPYVYISGLVCSGGSTGTDSLWQVNDGNSGFIFTNCGAINLAKSGTDSVTAYGFATGAGGTFRCCCVGAISAAGATNTASKKPVAYAFVNTNTSGAIVRILHCSIENISVSNSGTGGSICGGVYALSSTSVNRVYNNAIGSLTATGASGVVDPFLVTSGAAFYCSSNAGEDSISEGTGNQTFTPADVFTDLATSTMDLHLRDDTSDLIGNGANISAYTNYPTVDIDGDTLDYDGGGDIGCDTWVSTVAPTLAIIGGEAGDDYETPQEWAAALPNPLDDIYVGRIRKGDYTAEGALNFPATMGQTSEHYVRLEAYPGDEWNGDFDGVGTYCPLVGRTTVSGDYTQIYGIAVGAQSWVSGGSLPSVRVACSMSVMFGNHIAIERCGFPGYTSTAGNDTIDEAACGILLLDVDDCSIKACGIQGVNLTLSQTYDNIAAGIYHHDSDGYETEISHCSINEIAATNSGTGGAIAHGIYVSGSGDVRARNNAIGTLTSDTTPVPLGKSGSGAYVGTGFNAGVSEISEGSDNITFTPSDAWTDAAGADTDFRIKNGTNVLVGASGSLSGFDDPATEDCMGRTILQSGGGDIGCHQILRQSLSDTVGAGDAIGGTRGLTRILSDALGVSDATVRQLNIIKSLLETVGATDSLQAFLGRSAVIDDQIGIADEVLRVAALIKAVSDTIGLSDALSRSAEFFRSISDSEGIADSVRRLARYYRVQNDTVGLTDEIDFFNGLLLEIADTLGMSDELERQADFIKAIADTLGLTESLTKVHAFIKENSDTIGLSDSVDSKLIAATFLAAWYLITKAR